MDKRVNYGDGNETSINPLVNFPIFELPVNLIYVVLSSLPLKTILNCKRVCKTFLKLLEEPYFSEIHLAKSAITASSLIFPEQNRQGQLSICMLDLNKTRSTSPSSTNHSYCLSHGIENPLRKPNLKFCFLSETMHIVGSCNGLLCLYKKDPQKPIYCILNPILGEYTVLPRPNPANPNSNLSQETGFGFCPKSKQYKIIRFMLMDNTKTVADIYTLGTRSWRKIGNVPNPKKKIGFDPFLNGSLYWVTDSKRSCNLICSFDLETEKIKSVQPPSVFENSGYLSKTSKIGVGSMRNCLCLCYVYEELHFVVWVMKENGSNSDKCWSNSFSIDFRSYCGLSAKDFPRPIKFVENGDGGELLLLCNLLSLFLYSPKKRTFRDVGMISSVKTDVFAYTPSFISIKDAAEVAGKYLKVKKFRQGQQLSPLRDEFPPEST